MSRVLLICPEPLGHGQPAGIGIRFTEMARVLLADGHRVTVVSPDAGAVAGCESAALTPQALALHTSTSDVAVVQGHASNALFAHGRQLPTVVDLYDPFIIENLHYYADRGGEVFTHDHKTLLQSVARGDFFLCASEAQRMFYAGLLLAAGRLNPVAFETSPRLDQLLAIAPFGVQPARERAAAAGHAILFGGIYDWYDPLLAIDAVILARESIPKLTLTFTRHPNPQLTPQGRTAEAMAHARKKGAGEFIHFEPWVEYEKRGEFLDRFSLALLTFPQSIETDLSMRTRVYDYLWGGVPIVTSSAPGTDALLAHYNAGSVIAIDSPEAFATEIVAILRDSQRHQKMVAGARSFVADHQWPRALEPLREFCLRPRIDPAKETFAAHLEVPERAASIFDRLRRRIGGSF